MKEVRRMSGCSLLAQLELDGRVGFRRTKRTRQGWRGVARGETYSSTPLLQLGGNLFCTGYQTACKTALVE